MDLPVGAEIGSAFGAARLAAGRSAAEVCVKPPVRRSFAPRPSNAPLPAKRCQHMQTLYLG
jgi:hypothetical protein